MLSPEQIANAQAAIAVALDPLKSEGARVTLGPVLQGPLSKGEFQIFYAGSSYGIPRQETFNASFAQDRTVRFAATLLLKDLRNPDAAMPILEASKGLLTGLQIFGPQPSSLYAGALYPASDSFQELTEEAFYFYSLELRCEVREYLPEPIPPTGGSSDD
jgi:hypothetical protein